LIFSNGVLHGYDLLHIVCSAAVETQFVAKKTFSTSENFHKLAQWSEVYGEQKRMHNCKNQSGENVLVVLSTYFDPGSCDSSQMVNAHQTIF